MNDSVVKYSKHVERKVEYPDNPYGDLDRYKEMLLLHGHPEDVVDKRILELKQQYKK